MLMLLQAELFVLVLEFCFSSKKAKKIVFTHLSSSSKLHGHVHSAATLVSPTSQFSMSEEDEDDVEDEDEYQDDDEEEEEMEPVVDTELLDWEPEVVQQIQSPTEGQTTTIHLATITPQSTFQPSALFSMTK